MSTETYHFHVSMKGPATSEDPVRMFTTSRAPDPFMLDDVAETVAECCAEALAESSNARHLEVRDMFLFCVETQLHYKFSVTVECEPYAYASRECGYPSKNPEGEPSQDDVKEIP